MARQFFDTMIVTSRDKEKFWGFLEKKWDLGGFLDDLEQKLFFVICRLIYLKLL